MTRYIIAFAMVLGFSACGGGGGGSSAPTGPSAVPVAMTVAVISSDGQSLGSFALTGQTGTQSTITFVELAGKSVRSAGMHEKFMVLRGANQGDRVGGFVVNTSTGTLSFVPREDRTLLTLWLFPNGRFPYTNNSGHQIDYGCFSGKSGISFLRGIPKRYGVTVGKFRAGTPIWSGPWKGPGYDLGMVNIIAYDGPDYPIIEALTLLNRFLTIGSIKLGSFAYTGAPDSGDMVGGWGYDEAKQPGFEGLHDSQGQWFIQRYDRAFVNKYGDRAFAYSWRIQYVEALEAWTRGDDVCGDQSFDTLFSWPVGEHASSGWTDVGIDLLRFAALMAPTD
jgi:hypothetical protein